MKPLVALFGVWLCLALVMPAWAADEDKKDADKPAPAAADKKPAADEKKKDEKKDEKKPADEKKKDEKKDEGKKGDEKPDSSDSTEVKEKLVPAGQLTGKLVDVQVSQKVLGIEITQKIPVPNQGEYQAIAQLQAQIPGALAQPKAIDRITQLQNIQAQIAQHRANLISYQDKTQKIELRTADDVKVRVAQPPAQFDEKGNPKRYTPKELRELRGSDKLWGFPADFDSLHQGQIVEVTLGQHKDAARVNIMKGKEIDKEALEESKPLITAVYVLQEPPAQ